MGGRQTEHSTSDDPGEPTDRRSGADPGAATVSLGHPAAPDHNSATVIGRGRSDDTALTSPAVGGVSRIGEFEILGEIARGGMGVVYRARQRGVNRVVALKMMLGTQGMSAEERGRFQAEAEAAGQLDHPNIVAVHAIGEDDGRPYLSMALVEGSSLKQIVSDGPLAPKRAATLMEKIARAVHYAHSRGIVHRDLKPANVLIDTDGEPRVTDFGLAKRTAKDSGLTATGQILGTPSYMPPEQAAGKTEEVGVAADIYSLGATLYCLLAGRPPFQAASVIETLQQVIQLDPIPPRQWNPQLPRDLETICLKALSKSPADRYATAADLAEELRRFLAGEPILARPLGRMERAVRWARRRPTEAGLALVSVLALVALAIVGVSLSYQNDLARSLDETERQRTVAESQRTEAQKQRVIAEQEKAVADGLRIEADGLRTKAESERTIAVDARGEAEKQRLRAEFQETQARRFLYGSQINVAMQMWDEANLGQMARVLDGLRPADGAEDLRGFEWQYLDRLRRFGFDYARLPPHPGLSSMSLTPDGKRLATSGGAMIRVLDVETRLPAWERPTPVRVINLLWDRQGNRLFAGYADGRIAILDASGEPLRTSEGLPKAAVVRLALSANESRLAALFGNGRVAVLDCETLAPVARWSIENGSGGLDFAGDGERVLTTVAFGDRVRGWNASDGSPAEGLEGTFDGMSVIRRDPSGQWAVASAISLSSAIQWDLRTGRQVRRFTGHERRIEDVAMTADVEKLLTASDDSTVRLWEPQSGDQHRILRGHAGPVHFAAISADGRRAVSGTNKSEILEWDLSADPLSRRMAGHDGWVFRAIFSPDGERVASAGRDSTVRLWNARTGELLKTLTGHSKQTEALAFSLDGSRLYSSGDDATIRVWNLADMDSPPQVWTGHTAPLWGISMSPDGKRLASCSHDLSVRIWDTATGRCEQTWTGHTRRVMDVAWHPRDAEVLSAAEDGTVRCWSLTSGRELWSHPVTGANDVAISPAGDLMATSGVGVVQVWWLPERTRKFELRGSTNTVYQLDFSPDGKRLVTGGADGSARVWDMATGQQLLRTKHDSTVFSVAFSRDGRKIVTASRDETIRVLDSLDP